MHINKLMEQLLFVLNCGSQKEKKINTPETKTGTVLDFKRKKGI